LLLLIVLLLSKEEAIPIDIIIVDKMIIDIINFFIIKPPEQMFDFIITENTCSVNSFGKKTELTFAFMEYYVIIN
jgi:hypothetical protein